MNRPDRPAQCAVSVVRHIVALSATSLVCCVVQAQVYKCPDAAGKTSYQSEPCEGGKALKSESRNAMPASAPKRELDVFTKTLRCGQLSKQVEGVAQFPSLHRSAQDNTNIDTFRKSCAPLGFQFPDNRAAIQYNHELGEKAMSDYQAEMNQRDEERRRQQTR